MVGTFGMGIIQLIVLISLGGGGGLPLGVPPAPEDPNMMRVAPDECLYYATWSGITVPLSTSDNSTERFIANPELLSLFVKLDREIVFWLERRAEDDEAGEEMESITGALRLLRGVLTHHTAVYIEDVQLDEGEIDVSGAIIVKFGRDAEEARSVLIDVIEANAPEDSLETISIDDNDVVRVALPSNFVFEVSSNEDYLIVGIGPGSTRKVLANLATPAPQWLTDIRAAGEDAGIERLSTVSYIDVSSIYERLEGPEAAPVMDMLEMFGLDDIQQYNAITGLDDTGFVSRIEIPLAEDADGIFEMLDGVGLTPEDLQTIPSNASMGVALNISPEEMLDLWMDVLRTMDPFSADLFDDALQSAGDPIGVDIRKDILRSLGDQVNIYASQEDGGFITGWILAVEVKSHMTLMQTNQLLVDLFRKEFEGSSYRLESLELNGREIFYVLSDDEFMPFTPTWCLTGKELVIAPFSQVVKSHIRRLGDSENLANNRRVQDLLLADADARILAVGQIDHAELVQHVYPFVQMLLNFGMSELASQAEFNLSIGDLPSVAALSQELEPGISVLRRTERGLVFESNQTIPSGDIGASLPVLASLSIPAVFAARDAAMRTQSANNMKQIGLALHNHLDVHRAFPPPHTVNEDGKPLLSWRVRILPYIEQHDLYERFNHDEPWNSEHNLALVSEMPFVLALPGTDPTEGKTVYQGINLDDALFGPLGMDDLKAAQGGLGRNERVITDGMSNTIIVVETNPENAVIWTKPDDFDAPGMNMLNRLTGNWSGGQFQALFGDASVRSIRGDLDDETLLRLFKMSDGEPVDWAWIDGFGARGEFGDLPPDDAPPPPPPPPPPPQSSPPLAIR